MRERASEHPYQRQRRLGVRENLPRTFGPNARLKLAFARADQPEPAWAVVDAGFGARAIKLRATTVRIRSERALIERRIELTAYSRGSLSTSSSHARWYGSGQVSRAVARLMNRSGRGSHCSRKCFHEVSRGGDVGCSTARNGETATAAIPKAPRMSISKNRIPV